MRAASLPMLALAAIVLALPASSQIRPNEALEITIKGVPEEDRNNISNVYPVSEGGSVNLPYIGIVRAAGMKSMELAKQIEKFYRVGEIYTSPTVNVKAVTDTRLVQKQIVVGGQVRRPGPVQFRVGITLWQAIQGAGGDTEFAAVRRVELHRETGVQTFDLRDNEAKNHPLQENDSIIVPQKRPFERGW